MSAAPKRVEATQDAATKLWSVTSWFDPPPQDRHVTITPDGHLTERLTDYGDRCEVRRGLTGEQFEAYLYGLGWSPE